MTNYLSPLFEEIAQNYHGDLTQLYPSGMAIVHDTCLSLIDNNRVRPLDRGSLADALLVQQKRYQPNKCVFESIEKIRSQEASVVVSGQQPNLFGGPLMILYKALTCISLAKHLCECSDVPVVPLFWIAGDDSDLRECNSIESAASDKLYSLKFTDPEKRIPVGNRIIVPEHMEQIEEICNDYPSQAHIIKKCYYPGISLADAFGKLLHSFLASKGLILIDGNSELVKKNGRKTLIRFIEEHKGIHEHLSLNKNIILDSGKNLQVTIPFDTIRAFDCTTGERKRIHYNESFDIKSMQLSHDVLSRPLVCDTIFPVAAHVLGPAELKYFGLLSGVYNHLEIPFPAVYSRCHATLYKSSFYKKAEALNCSLYDLTEISLRSMIVRLGEIILREKGITSSILMINPEIENLLHGHLFPQHLLQMITQRANSTNLNLYKKMCKSIIRDNKELHANIKDVYTWLGSGRKQERVIPFLEVIDRFGFEHFEELILPMEFTHQQIVI